MTTPDDTLLSALTEFIRKNTFPHGNCHSTAELLKLAIEAQREAYCRSVCPDCANRIPEPTRIGNVWIHAAGSFTESECRASSIRSAPWAVSLSPDKSQ